MLPRFTKKNQKQKKQQTLDAVCTRTHTSVTLTKKRIVIALLTIVIGIVAISNIIWKNQKPIKQKENIYDSELTRSMTYEQVKDEDKAISNCEYVNFDAFFLRDLDGDGNAEGIRGTCKEINATDILYIEFSVNKNGYLKDGEIIINGSNFKLSAAIPKESDSGEIAQNAIGEDVKEIQLNTIKNGTQKLLTGTIKKREKNNINWYSEENNITLKGVHVSDDNIETPIEKKVKLKVDWYGDVKANIRDTYQRKELSGIFDNENREINLNFYVWTEEKNEKLLLRKNEVKAVIPTLNDYEPIRVEAEDSQYNPATRELIITKNAELNEKQEIIKNVYQSQRHSITVTYPIEAYEELGSDTIEIKIPVEAYYEGFNNTNKEFQNPYKSNTCKTTITVTFRNTIQNTGILVRTGKLISGRYVVSKKQPLKIYNGTVKEDTKDTYNVTWNVTIGKQEEPAKVILKETENGESQVSDVFIKKDSTEDSMKDITKNIGIYFHSAQQFVGEDGWIKVYDDETNELIITFSKDNWNMYTYENPYMYKTPIKHIRIETSEVKSQTSISIQNIKELDDEYITEHYTKEEFDNLQYIKSTLTAYLGERKIATDLHSANYDEEISEATLTIYNNVVSTQENKKDFKINISAYGSDTSNTAKWQNGAFLLKFPEEIIDVKINEIKTNNEEVSITNYETYKEGNNIFIKILTENETEQSYGLTIYCDIVANPKIASIDKDLELYASNELCQNYKNKATDIYDINGNLNTTENIEMNSEMIRLVAPSSLLTYQEAKEYDAQKSTAIAPKVAIVEKDQRTAEIELGIINNYSDTISDIQILGRIPTTGNTYILTNENMSSNFNTTIKENGIQIPEELVEKAKVYYSEKMNATNDLTDTENNWTLNPTEWQKIKSYLIIIENYTMSIKEKQIFSYQIEIPEGLEYNQISYSHHGVYFNLDTAEGKYKTQVAPNKLGFIIAKQFDVELIKYQKGSNKVIPGVTFSIFKDGENEENTKVTNETGKIEVNKLYAERTYVIKEIKTPKQYALNQEQIKFTTKVNEAGELEAELINGTLRAGTELVVNKTEKGYVISIQVEDEVRPNIKIIKLEQNTENRIPKVKYKMSGTGISGQERIITTDKNGEITEIGLYLNNEYTLTETKAEGYYLAEPIKFVIEQNGSEYSLRTLEGTIKNYNVTFEDEIPTVNIYIENEKIPRYSLNITKQEKGNETKKIEGAKFKLFKDNKVIGEYTSDVNGKINIENLYQYQESKKINQTYILKEVLAPQGYAAVKDITFKVESVNNELQFKEELSDETLAKTYTVEGEVINLIIEDSTSFKLVKKDGSEPNEPIVPGVKFAIYNIENNEEPAKDSKGNIVGTKEIINGKEYYTVITNEKGEITADLTQGLYKAVEVEADDKYDIENKIYYFGIGESKECKNLPYLQSVITDIPYNMDFKILDDGSMIAAGGFSEKITLRNGETFNCGSTVSSLIIKYDEYNQIEWVRPILGYETRVCNIFEAEGGYIAVGYTRSDKLYLGDETFIETGTGKSGFIIKLDKNGKVIASEINIRMSSMYDCCIGHQRSNGDIIINPGGYTLVYDSNLNQKEVCIAQYTRSKNTFRERGIYNRIL